MAVTSSKSVQDWASTGGQAHQCAQLLLMVDEPVEDAGLLDDRVSSLDDRVSSLDDRVSSLDDRVLALDGRVP